MDMIADVSVRMSGDRRHNIAQERQADFGRDG
jgi:hypothetical protein